MTGVALKTARPGHTPFFIYACHWQRSIPPTPWTDGTHLRHLIIFPSRVSQTVIGEHELEAAAYGRADARRCAITGRPGQSVQLSGEEGTNLSSWDWK